MENLESRADSILLCGGRGIRLLEITRGEIPKPLIEVAGKPLLQYSLDTIDPSYVERLIFAVDFQAEQIIEWVRLTQLPYQISFSEQSVPGVLNAVVSALTIVRNENFITFNTDEINFGFQCRDMFESHLRSNRLVTMLATYSDKLYRHRILTVRDPDNLVIQTELNPEQYRTRPDERALINAGIIIMHQRAQELFDPIHSPDWSGIIDPLTDAGQLTAYVVSDMSYFNVGTPEEFNEAEEFLRQQTG